MFLFCQSFFCITLRFTFHRLVSLNRRYNVEGSLKDTIRKFLEEEKIYTPDLIDAAVSCFDPQTSVSDFLSISQNEHVLKGAVCLKFV